MSILSEKHVTPIQEWIEKSRPLIDIPGFMPGETITVRVKPISMVELVKSGKIPNALLKEATQLFSDNKSGMSDQSMIEILGGESGSKLLEIIDTVAEAALVEPSYSEVKDMITDDQKMAIFNFTQGEVKDLKSFREEPGNTGLSGNESVLPG